MKVHAFPRSIALLMIATLLQTGGAVQGSGQPIVLRATYHAEAGLLETHALSPAADWSLSFLLKNQYCAFIHQAVMRKHRRFVEEYEWVWPVIDTGLGFQFPGWPGWRKKERIEPVQFMGDHTEEPTSSGGTFEHIRLPVSDNLEALESARGEAFATALAGLLKETGFDLGNSSLRDADRGGNYNTHPFPLPALAMNVQAMRDWMAQIQAGDAVAPEGYTRRTRLALEFFMFGTALGPKPLAEVFGSSHSDLIEKGIALGLFRRTDGRVHMNGLSLVSSTLPGGEVIYIFADTPPYFDSYSAAERVYIGPDSYLLRDRVFQERIREGIVAEAGSGSGFQLISLLRAYPTISMAVGLEIDRRAIAVSRFNSFLNGVHDRLAIVDSAEAFHAALQGKRVDLAITNPPFIAFPETADIDPRDRLSWSRFTTVDSHEPGRFTVNLRSLWAAAGWGGPDGLRITRQFLDLLLPVLNKGARMIIFSSFGGTNAGPESFIQEIERKKEFSALFEPESPRTLVLSDGREGRTRSVQEAWEAAIGNVAIFLQQHPEFNADRRGMVEAMQRLVAIVEDGYRKHNITHFHGGFVVIERHAQATTDLMARLRMFMFAWEYSWEGTRLRIRSTESQVWVQAALPEENVVFWIHELVKNALYEQKTGFVDLEVRTDDAGFAHMIVTNQGRIPYSALREILMSGVKGHVWKTNRGLYIYPGWHKPFPGESLVDRRELELLPLEELPFIGRLSHKRPGNPLLGGNGQGLFSLKYEIEKMGGKFRLESFERDHQPYTSATITFPLANPSSGHDVESAA